MAQDGASDSSNLRTGAKLRRRCLDPPKACDRYVSARTRSLPSGRSPRLSI